MEHAEMGATYYDNSFDPILLPALVLVAVVAWIFFGRQPPSFWQRLSGDLDRLRNELHDGFDRRTRLPVYPVRGANRREAELDRERLRRKVPRLLLTLALMVIGIVVWTLTR